MVKIAIAGGTGSTYLTLCIYGDGCPHNNFCIVDVAQEILDVFITTKKHEIVLLSRKVRPYAFIPV